MAKVQLDRAKRKVSGFSIWVAGMLKVTKRTQEELARYLCIDRTNLSRRIHGASPWTLEEYFETQEFFGEEFRANER